MVFPPIAMIFAYPSHSPTTKDSSVTQLTLRLIVLCSVPLTLTAWFATPARAGVIWDESSNGSLSTDRFNTTDLGILSAGNNNLIADTQNGISKFFTFTIADGKEWSGLVLDAWISVDDLAFLGVVKNSFFDVDPASPDVTKLLGYVHHGASLVGQDILPQMGQGPGSQGFTPPLGPGVYSFWLRQGSAELTTQNLNFVVTDLAATVPEAASVTMWLLGISASGAVARRRRRKASGHLNEA